MWLHTSTIGDRRVIAFDGKTLRGARGAAGNLVHLLAGLCQQSGAVLAQLAVDVNTNDIPMLEKLLDTLDITGTVITAVDAGPWSWAVVETAEVVFAAVVCLNWLDTNHNGSFRLGWFLKLVAVQAIQSAVPRRG